MKLLLVRNAKATARKAVSDALRPLMDTGHAQARAIADHLMGEPLARIVSGPELRCQQTIEPLTLSSGVPVEVDERLESGDELSRALELLPTSGEGTVVFCTNRETILGLLHLFELGDPDAAGTIPVRKGSIWVLEGPGTTPISARYLEPTLRPPDEAARLRLAVETGRAAESVRAAVLDLGSTSFTLLIADVTSEGGIRPVVRERVMLRLGAVLADHGSIPEEVCTRAVEVARELRAIATQEKVQRMLPVATAALRDAPNGAELTERIGRAVETPVRVLTGEEEARVIFRAFRARLALPPEPSLGLDLGGGSLELAVGGPGGVLAETTLPLGVARLQRELVHNDPMKGTERSRIRDRVRTALAPHREKLLGFAPRVGIAAGGGPRAIGRLHDEKLTARRRRPGGPTDLPVDTLRELTAELVRSDHGERLAMRGMRKGRADLLPTAAVILSTVAHELYLERITLCDWGLREGILLEALG